MSGSMGMNGWMEYQSQRQEQVDECYWYDEQVLDYFDKYGVR